MTDDRLAELMAPPGVPRIAVASLADDPDYVKCPRCWHYTHEGLDNHDGLCDRCCRVMMDAWPDHPATPLIAAKWETMKTKWSSQCKTTKTK